ncbi:MAG: signal transduction histidine kinase [Cognaticolwellia sp.]|jgi:signal transduction histidine kinase
MPWKSPLADSDVLTLMMDYFPDLLFVKDDEYRILAANERFLSLYPPDQRDQGIGTTTLEAYSEEQRDLFLVEDLKALTAGESGVVERIDFPGGQTRAVLTKKVGKTGISSVRRDDPWKGPAECDSARRENEGMRKHFEDEERSRGVRAQASHVVSLPDRGCIDGQRYLIAAAVDITELEESRGEAAQLWELIEHTSAEIFIVDAQTLGVLRMSGGAVENLGLSEQSSQGISFRECLDPALLEVFLAIRGELSADPGGRHAMSGRHLRQDGSHYEVRAQVLSGRLAATNVIVVVVQDVTDDNERQRTLTRQNDALNEFAYRISHDLRVPVVSGIALIGLAEEMLVAGNTVQACELLGRTTEVLTQAEKLAADLLTLTRIEQLDLKIDKVSLLGLVEESISRDGVLYDLDGLEFRVELGDVESLVTSSERLRSILDNLVSNTLEYRDSAQEKSWVRISARRDVDVAEVRVQDNGLGIEAAYRDKLFGMFQRFHARVAPGAGLGLFMVSRTAERLGGAARFEPAEPGACFIITLSERADRWN